MFTCNVNITEPVVKVGVILWFLSFVVVNRYDVRLPNAAPPNTSHTSCLVSTPLTLE